jgi:uncharacterized protein YdeI (YjbR/CyaY-like superfamily)
VKKTTQKKEPETYCPSSQADWRRWLKKNHKSKESIWLVLYKKNSGKPVIDWSSAVDEALCFGWIDSTRRPIDHEKFMQFFAKRKPKATWSKINKDKVKRLIAEGKMTKAGLDIIDAAKKNGAWTILDSVEKLTIPPDLAAELRARPGTKEFLESLPRSMKKVILHWVTLAKKKETREKRIKEVASAAAKRLKPLPFRAM